MQCFKKNRISFCTSYETNMFVYQDVTFCRQVDINLVDEKLEKNSKSRIWFTFLLLTQITISILKVYYTCFIQCASNS